MENNQSLMNPELALAGRACEFLIGNVLLVTRLGFGTMRITGKGIWGQPANRAGRLSGSCGELSNWDQFSIDTRGLLRSGR